MCGGGSEFLELSDLSPHRCLHDSVAYMIVTLPTKFRVPSLLALTEILIVVPLYYIWFVLIGTWRHIKTCGSLGHFVVNRAPLAYSM